MNFWTLIFASANLLLCIRIIFCSNSDRQESRWGYRLLLFLVAVYAGWQVISVVYHPFAVIGAWVAILHAGLFLIAFFMRPEYLPGNCSYDATKQAYLELGHTLSRAWFWLWSAELHGREGKARPPGH